MTTLEQRIEAFARLGQLLEQALKEDANIELTANESAALKQFRLSLEQATQQNPWFIKPFLELAISNTVTVLNPGSLNAWTSQYPGLLQQNKIKTVAVIMAGNIPMVGFHDFLGVLISGNRFMGKLSSDDGILLPAMGKLLIAIEPAFDGLIEFAAGKINNFDSIIATGSNNTARYFEYYFGKYPNIIRRNRNGIAILSGNESSADLQALADDIFTYFGLGCRNVSKVYMPEGYKPVQLISAFEAYGELMSHNHKYYNNYEYNKAIMLVNNDRHYDNGFLLLKQSDHIASPVSVLHYSVYQNEEILHTELTSQSDHIQCVVSQNAVWPGSIPFGHTQKPALNDYADGIDTLNWLIME